MDVEDAQVLPKERAKKNVQKAGRPIGSSTIEVNCGQGRCMREVELIWCRLFFPRILVMENCLLGFILKMFHSR